MNDYHAYQSTSDGSGGGSGGGDFGCGWVVIVIVALLLIFFLIDGASWESIGSLLGSGLLTFFFAKSLFR